MIGPVPIPIKSNKTHEHAEKLLALWKIFRYLKHSNQIHPIFVGWIITQLTVMERKATVMTYLPPIESYYGLFHDH
jgi:Na+-transporting NADH:ubiquinone oxidoreductase subunit NqrD